MVKQKVKIELFDQNELISKPVLVSFPQNVPPKGYLQGDKSKVSFIVYEFL
jgi:hypothetical protein